MPFEELIYQGLRTAHFGLSVVAAVWGVLYARKVLGDPFRAGLVFVGSVVVLGAGTLSMYDAVQNFRARPDGEMPGEDWLWLIFDITLPVLFLLLLRVSHRRDLAEAQLRLLSVTDTLTGLVNRRGLAELALPALRPKAWCAFGDGYGRPRSLQADQRHTRSRGRRYSPSRSCPHHCRGRAGGRSPRPHRRRRVRRLSTGDHDRQCSSGCRATARGSLCRYSASVWSWCSGDGKLRSGAGREWCWRSRP